MRSTSAALLVVLSILALGGSARAHVRQHAQNTGAPLHWIGELVVTPDASGCVEIGADRSLEQIQAAAKNWNDAVASCSDMRIRVEPPAPSPGRAIDGVNTIVWREDEWGTLIDGELVPYGDEAIALTTLTYRDQEGRDDNGRIVDSDTELNGVARVFGIAGESAPGALDVQAVVTHELGHALGLAHTCWDGISPSIQPLDQRGEPVPDCFADLPEEVLATTMYPFSAPDESGPRSPEPDDVAGVCAIYPMSSEESGCALASPGASRTAWAALALAFLLVRRLTHRRARVRASRS